jgi:pimeloyl-ACP methyl ester carboxylesterase
VNVEVDPLPLAGLPAQVQRLRYRSPVDGAADWALLLPGRVPGAWVLQTHGHGSAGDQVFTRPDIRDAWLAHYVRRGLGVLSPNLRGDAWMCPAAAADLHALLAWLRREHGATDVYFVSGSMGGTSNLIYAVLHPQDVAAVAALCPATRLAEYRSWCRLQALPIVAEIGAAIDRAYGGPPEAAPVAYAAHDVLARADHLTMPVLLAHGSADALIPVEQSRALAARLRGRGTFLFREIPEGDHDAPLHRAGAMQWLDAQLRARGHLEGAQQ